MNYTQFHDNTFLFINNSKKVDLIMYYEEMEKPIDDTRKQYKCNFINKDGSEAKLCCNALLRLVEQEGLGHYVFHTISGIYEAWNDENELVIRMGEAFILKKNTLKKTECVIESIIVDVGNVHKIYVYEKNKKHLWGIGCRNLANIRIDDMNTHLVLPINNNTFQVSCFEKGVGETQACGSGAYAIGVAMMEHFNLDKVNIKMKGGKYLVKNGLLIVKK